MGVPLFVCVCESVDICSVGVCTGVGILEGILVVLCFVFALVCLFLCVL